MLNDKIGVCIVGPGFWAQQMHIPAFQSIPGVEVTCIVGSDKDRTRAVAETHGIKDWSINYEDAVRKDSVDVVDILAPNDLHAPISIAAAQAGKHVICIKPLALTLSEADRMIAAADAAGTRLFYAENVPFIPAVQEAKRVVDTGAIGEVFKVKASEGIGEPHSAWHYDMARCGGGTMIDMAVHSIEFCRAFAGAGLESVYADAGTFVWQDKLQAEDTATLALRFANGVMGTCEDYWSLAEAMDSRFEIYGTEGRILIDNLYRQPIQVVSSGGGTSPRGWSFPSPHSGAVNDGHVAMLGHFIEALRSGQPSLSDAAVGWNALAVIEAATQSLQTGSREVVRNFSKELVG